MTERLIEALFAALLVSFLSWLATFGVKVLFGNAGEVVMGPHVTIGQDSWYAIDVTNRGATTLDGLEFAVPLDLDTQAIVASANVELKSRAANGSPKQLLLVSGVPARQELRLLLPLSKASAAVVRPVAATNAREKDVTANWFDEVRPSGLEAARSSADSALWTALFYLAFALWSKTQAAKIEREMKDRYSSAAAEREKVKSQLEANEAKIQANEARIEALMKANGEARADYAKRLVRHKAIVLRRLSDYRTELDFWRDTIRKVVASNRPGRCNELLDAVTTNLKTFGTRDKAAQDFATIEALAQVLKEEN